MHNVTTQKPLEGARLGLSGVKWRDACSMPCLTYADGQSAGGQAHMPTQTAYFLHMAEKPNKKKCACLQRFERAQAISNHPWVLHDSLHGWAICRLFGKHASEQVYKLS